MSRVLTISYSYVSTLQYVTGKLPTKRTEAASSLTRSQMEKTRGNRYKLHRERFHQKISTLYSKSNQSLEQPPQGH